MRTPWPLWYACYHEDCSVSIFLSFFFFLLSFFLLIFSFSFFFFPSFFLPFFHSFFFGLISSYTLDGATIALLASIVSKSNHCLFCHIPYVISIAPHCHQDEVTLPAIDDYIAKNCLPGTPFDSYMTKSHGTKKDAVIKRWRYACWLSFFFVCLLFYFVRLTFFV
jgi:hypothetical protein